MLFLTNPVLSILPSPPLTSLCPEPLLTSSLPHLMAGVQRLIEEFDSRHVMYGNKEYADLLWQVGHV